MWNVRLVMISFAGLGEVAGEGDVSTGDGSVLGVGVGLAEGVGEVASGTASVDRSVGRRRQVSKPVPRQWSPAPRHSSPSSDARPYPYLTSVSTLTLTVAEHLAEPGPQRL
jgi:hypothetical protein